MTNSTSPGASVDFSIYLLPAAFAVLNFVACLSAILATYFDNSLFHSSWNILYQLKDFNAQYIYIIRVVYYYRKSTVDFNKTSLILQLTEVNDIGRTTLRIPPKFFDQNKHNTFNRDRGTIKFLLIRDTELKLIEKVGLTHDYQGGELNVSLVDIHNSTTNDGYIGCAERCIKSLNLDEMEKEQSFMTTAQANMELEGDFAITQGISPLEFISSLYLYFSIVSYLSAKYLVAYYIDYSSKQNYTFYNSLQEATVMGLSYFFFIFGLMAIIYDLTKYALDGKPRHRFMKIIYFYGAVCILIGIFFSINTVKLLDPDKLQYTLKDANVVSNFLRNWIKSAMFAMGVAIFYGIPFYVIYFVLISLIFKEYTISKST